MPLLRLQSLSASWADLIRSGCSKVQLTAARGPADLNTSRYAAACQDAVFALAYRAISAGEVWDSKLFKAVLGASFSLSIRGMIDAKLMRLAQSAITHEKKL